MVAFPRINAPKPAPSRRFSTFSTSSVGRLPWKNGLPRSLPATRVSIPPSNNRAPCRLAVPEKNLRAARLLVFSTAASAVIPAAQLPPSAGQIAVPRPSLRDPPPTPTPLPQGGASKAPEFLRGPLVYSYSALVHQRGLRPAVFFFGSIHPRVRVVDQRIGHRRSSITFLGGSSSMAGFISRRRSIRIELA